jgi:small subunit ribosomal protein S20
LSISGVQRSSETIGVRVTIVAFITIMPVTKTAKRALRGSKRKEAVNKLFMSRLEVALRLARKSPSSDRVRTAVSLVDRAVKKNLIHKNKAARVKSKLASLIKSSKPSSDKAPGKKLSKKSVQKGKGRKK